VCGLHLYRPALRCFHPIRRAFLSLERLAQENYLYADRITVHEIVRNERQKKPFDLYYALLNTSVQGMHRVLRPERFLTLTFHNPTFMVRNATVRAGVFAGFDYEHIHHQPLGQVQPRP